MARLKSVFAATSLLEKYGYVVPFGVVSAALDAADQHAWVNINTVPPNTYVDVWLEKTTPEADVTFYTGDKNYRRATSWKLTKNGWHPLSGAFKIFEYAKPKFWRTRPLAPLDKEKEK